MKNKQVYFNLAAQLIAFAVSFAISFFVSPIIIREVGKETYGFLGMANSFVGYVTIITVALNALAGRFVTIHLHRNEEETANRYFSSVFFSNLFIVAVLLIPAIIFILCLDKLFDVPLHSVVSVQITFGLVFLGFFVQLLCSVFSVATFATNKVYLTSLRTIEANVLRVAVIVCTFWLFRPNIAFVALGMTAYYVFVAITNVRYTKRLLPQIRVQRKCFDRQKIKELIVSGCWNSITALSNTLLEGLDLLISNVALGAEAMGTISIVKTIPSMINQCMSSVLGVFTPQLTICYAKRDIRGLLFHLNYACKLVGMLLSLPVAFVLVFGDSFFRLWLPAEDAAQLWGLSVLSMGSLAFCGSVVVMYNLFTVTNQLKKPALVTLLTGVANTTIVFLLLKTTDLGVYVIVAVSSVMALLRNLLFNIPYAAKCIEQSAGRFYWLAIRSLLFVCIAAVLGFAIKACAPIESWLHLIACAGAMCVAAVILVFVFFFSREEKQEVQHLLLSKLHRHAK